LRQEPTVAASLTPEKALSRQHRYGDSHVLAPRSRFIPDAILDLFECRAWPRPTVNNVKAVGSSVRADVAARMREMWR